MFFLVYLYRRIKITMYYTLLFSHSVVRWLVVISLLCSVFRAAKGYFAKSTFNKVDNAVRHWTATIAHIQLLIGIVLYFESPVVRHFFANVRDNLKFFNLTFFAFVHSTIMFTAVVFITIGSSRSKRMASDQEKFKIILLWYTLALLFILIAVPWPFSPFANRPYLR